MAPLGCATTRSEERLLAAVGLLRQAPVQFAPADDVPLGGVLWALPALLAGGLLRSRRVVDGLDEAFYATFQNVEPCGKGDIFTELTGGRFHGVATRMCRRVCIRVSRRIDNLPLVRQALGGFQDGSRSRQIRSCPPRRTGSTWVMSDIKFSCPQCQQHIQCEEGYAGMEIGCPTCKTRIVVPGRPAAPPTPPPPPANPCPGCGAALAPAAILCVHCGFNLRTGQRPQSRSASTPGRAPARDAWWRSSNLYLGLLVAILIVLYCFARSSEGALFGFVALQLLFTLTVQIIVIVAAFREDAGTGFLTLCIPFYAIYFVFSKSESPLLKKLYTTAIIANLATATLKGVE